MLVRFSGSGFCGGLDAAPRSSTIYLGRHVTQSYFAFQHPDLQLDNMLIVQFESILSESIDLRGIWNRGWGVYEFVHLVCIPGWVALLVKGITSVLISDTIKP